MMWSEQKLPSWDAWGNTGLVTSDWGGMKVGDSAFWDSPNSDFNTNTKPFLSVMTWCRINEINRSATPVIRVRLCMLFVNAVYFRTFWTHKTIMNVNIRLVKGVVQVRLTNRKAFHRCTCRHCLVLQWLVCTFHSCKSHLTHCLKKMKKF